MAWIEANWPIPEARVGSRRTATRVTPGAICLSTSSHFALVPYSKLADLDRLAPGIDRRHPMERRKSNQLYATAVKKRAGTDHKGIDRLLRKARKDCIDVATVAGVEQFEWLPNGRGCRAEV